MGRLLLPSASAYAAHSGRVDIHGFVVGTHFFVVVVKTWIFWVLEIDGAVVQEDNFIDDVRYGAVGSVWICQVLELRFIFRVLKIGDAVMPYDGFIRFPKCFYQ